KSAVRAFVSFRDKPSNGGRLWAANLLQQLKRRWSWRELLQRLPSIPDAVRAVQLLSPDWQRQPLWIDDGRGSTPPEQGYERIRKAIRDLERHARTKREKAEQVYQRVLAALPPWARQRFPGIEAYLRLY